MRRRRKMKSEKTTYMAEITSIGYCAGHRTQEDAISALKAAQDANAVTDGQVVAMTVSGRWRSQQVVYPTVGQIYGGHRQG
jgi:hypothetical protein